MSNNKTEKQRQGLRQSDTIKRTKVRKFIQKVKSNSKCVLCGYDHCIDALEFHHLGNKSMNLSKCKTFSQAANEMMKCIVVCANCHRELHAGLYEIDYLLDLVVDIDDVLRAKSEYQGIRYMFD